jgi:molybdopterin-containing oxidoreductase family iron-sulfur binding subunit
VENGDRLEVKSGSHVIEGPAYILPGQAKDTVTVHLGYGRKKSGRVGNLIGFDVSEVRTLASPWVTSGVTVRKTGGRSVLASTQRHFQMEGRDVVKAGSLLQFIKDPNFLKSHEHESEEEKKDYFDNKGRPFEDENYAWGMSINLNVCNGCNACIVACQSENNIATVGKEEVNREREMHWLRVDRYYEGNPDNPEVYSQPVPCMQCESAPCEVVCPVGATSHSPDGMNDMTYNRCVGTKYCSNNCPYKVRRFNFYYYTDTDTPSLKMQRNPDVTVRSLGVMEKCTYCVQRVNAGKINAKKENRVVKDGEVKTACQAVCPTQAIVFGNLKDKTSEVVKAKESSLDFVMFPELGTRPRTSYIAQIKNYNPELKTVSSTGHSEGH